MKKPKIKPEVVWMAVIGGRFHPMFFGEKPNQARDKVETWMGDDWPDLRKQGWRVVKVRISECK